MSNKFWYNWLIGASFSVMLFSLGLILLPETMQSFFNLVYFGAEDADGRFSKDATEYIYFVNAVLGGVMMGWMTAILYVLVTSFRHGETTGWNIITVSLAIWFVIDSSASIATGFAENAVLNLGFLLMFAVPLAATYRIYHQG